jgi:hypothetical protein
MPDPGRIDRVLTYITGISTWKQALILIVLGAAILLGVMIYQHPYWIENVWRYSHGLELRSPH